MVQEKVADILSRQRVKLGLSVEDICRKTLIRQVYIEAIERGDYAAISDAVYTRGFIRNYAKAIGLNGDSMVRQWSREQEETAGPAHSEGTKVSRQKKPAHEFSRTSDVMVRAAGKRPFNAVEWIIIAAVTGLIILFWLWMLYF